VIELRFFEVIESTLRHSHDVRTNVAFCSQFFRNKNSSRLRGDYFATPANRLSCIALLCDDCGTTMRQI